MVKTSTSRAARVHDGLGHPVVDADGHYMEIVPVLKEFVEDYIKRVGGSRLLDRAGFLKNMTYKSVFGGGWASMTPQERRDTWTYRPAWSWGLESNVLDRATAILPSLMHERLDELGIDFAVLYPSQSVVLTYSQDDELRQVCCRALNTYNAELFKPYADRMTPVAVIPMHTPEEAIAELEYVAGELGLKAISIRFDTVRRPIKAVHDKHPELLPYVHHMDTFGIDSAYDYDPVWRKCEELGLAPASHTGGQGWGTRRSISSYVHNHLGSFAAAGDTLCRALFLGGVTRRFPRLNFAFLEGGVGWACNLFADIVGHWEKRNIDAFKEPDPNSGDDQRLMEMVSRYGNAAEKTQLGAIAEWARDYLGQAEARPETIDEWAACKIERPQDVHDLFVPNFYFGCEADDPMNAWAFDARVNPFGARLRAMFGSDISHWDVPDMTEVLPEAYELVERGLITGEDFEDFAFANAVRFYGTVNPGFFKGTRVEAEAVKVLAAEAAG